LNIQKKLKSNLCSSSSELGLISEKEKLSYNEIGSMVSYILRIFQENSIVKGDYLGILIPRSIDQVVVVLACIISGVVFIPLDSEYFYTRSERILKMIDFKAIMTDKISDVPHKIISTNKIIMVEISRDFGTKDLYFPDFGVSKNDTAYILFTSGTTSFPKGVEVTYRNLENYLKWCMMEYGREKIDFSIMHGPISFDATITSFLFPLVNKTTVKISTLFSELDDLAEIMKNSSANCLFKITPTHLSLLSRMGVTDSLNRNRHTFVIGGEQLKISILLKWMESFPNSTFFNEYGPTEATVGCIVKKLSLEDIKRTGLISIGKPIPNVSAKIDLKIEESGTKRGELILSGTSISKGYINKSEFESSPFVKVDNILYYKTGDLVELIDGEYYYLGRLKEEIKCNGYRVSVQEIDDEISKILTSIIFKTILYNGKIITFIESEINKNKLRDQLSVLLPRYMIPQKIITIDKIKVDKNGKIDNNYLKNYLKKLGE
jgi:non-ribosomal peptide synthase, putative